MDYKKLEPQYLLHAVEEFMKGVKVKEISDGFNEKYRDLIDANRLESVNRQMIYPMIIEARRRGFISIMPPVETALVQRIKDCYGIDGDGVGVSVRESFGVPAIDYLAHDAAKLLQTLISDVYEKRRAAGIEKPRVHLGWSGGATVMKVARELARLMAIEGPHVPLCLHVLNSGFNVTRPNHSPISFLSYFEEKIEDLKYVGLFAPAVVDAADYARAIKLPGVIESFNRSKEVDIVVTSLAEASDGHGELSQLIEIGGKKRKQPFTSQGWVGDVSYRPFSAKGPIEIKAGIKSVSVFELPDLVKLAATDDKHVVLVGAPCNRCGKSKGDALRPLLKEPSLKIWTHVFMDMATAQTVVP